MTTQIFPRWRGALVMLFVLADALYLPARTPDFWLALLVAGVLSALLLTLLIRVCGAFDPLATRAGGALLATLALICGAQSLLRLGHFFQATTFPTLPLLLTGALVLLVAVLLARGGLTRLTAWALPTLIVVLVPLALSLALTAHALDPGALLPLLPQGALPFCRTVFMCMLRIYAPVLLLFFLLQNHGHTRFSCAVSLPLSGAVLGLIAARSTMLLGLHTGARVPYPTYAAAGLAEVGDFFQRAEVLIAGCFSLCELARLAVLLLCVWRGGKALLRHHTPTLH